MIDFIHIVVVIAAVSGPGGQWQEPRSAHKRGFNAAECSAAVAAVPVGAKTHRGDTIVISTCVPAMAPDPKPEPAEQPDARLKGSI